MDRAGKVLNQLLSHLLERDQNSDRTEYAEFLNKWEFIVSKRLYGHVKIVDLKNENLFIAVDHSGWLQLLRLEEKTILKKTRKLFPALKIKSIKIQVNNEYFESDNIGVNAEIKEKSLISVDFDDIIEAEEIDKIENKQFKELMKRLYQSIVKKDEEG